MPCDDTMLDNPVWWSLSSFHRNIALTRGTALAMQEPLGPFAAGTGHSADDINDLVSLVRHRQAPALTMSRDLPFGLDIAPSALGVQLLAADLAAPGFDPGIEDLTPADACEIFDLAQRTRPGPFERRTCELGEFIGIKRGGVLIAMAGQRMKLPGYTEISAVCVDRAYRSRGFGAALVLDMAARIMAQGHRPFLHTYADNKTAIALYERLGFRIRTDVKLLRWDAQTIAAATAFARQTSAPLSKAS